MKLLDSGFRRNDVYISFSCLIDADRIDNAGFENTGNKKLPASGPPNWQPAIDRMELHLSGLAVRNPVDVIRNQISTQCRKRADDQQGIYTLTAPTGGGKTFASFRYALHHAKKHKLDHIYYIIPYTSATRWQHGHPLHSNPASVE